MDLVQHCELCDHQQKDYIEGSFCKFTNKKPEFNTTCIKIGLTNKCEKRIKEVNIAYQKVMQRKTITWLYFCIFLTIGLSFIIGGIVYLVTTETFFRNAYKVPGFLIIFGVGFLFISFPPLKGYLRDKYLTEKKKNTLDSVLQLYGVTYNIVVKLGKEKNGDPKIHTQLTIKKNR
ncbi:hypothetical protein NBRC110019_16250 [Neptunitalea chrysea]|uniref:Uncharacterized protein n=1 Tax=Neptunitalea chrysea TaxID=1647581 RepID=A0A9W6B4V5_9FLAO|nr:hypothetical protein [Neptunitalea chrysea]GLB52585.1 hypothetical protein NBRC110019_16250 [Neptunitalea chrysea]